jgi:hypothetical protein
MCPAKGEKICAICCGEKREVEIDCPGDCVYLRQGRRFGTPSAVSAPSEPRRQFSQQFRHRYAMVITALAHAILEERQVQPALLDRDVQDAFEALRATANTLSSGLYYDTPTEGGLAARGLHQRVRTLLERMMAPAPSGATPLRPADAADVLDFVIVSVELHSAGRPKSRRYLDWLSAALPPPPPASPPSGDDDSGGVIVP